MKRKVRNFPDEVKAEIVKRALAGEPVVKLAKGLKAHESAVYRWLREARKPAQEANGTGSKADGRMEHWVKGERAQLLQLLGEQLLEIMRLKGRAK